MKMQRAGDLQSRGSCRPSGRPSVNQWLQREMRPRRAWSWGIVRVLWQKVGMQGGGRLVGVWWGRLVGGVIGEGHWRGCGRGRNIGGMW